MPKYTIEDKHLREPKKRGKDIIAFCPFHDDEKTPNLSVFNDRKSFKCHACGKGGTAYYFLQETNQLPDKPRGRPVTIPTDADVKQYHMKLINNKKALDLLEQKRGWNVDTIKQLQIGLRDDFITIPIRSKNETLLNIRQYDVLHKTNYKFLPWQKGLGKRVDLFPGEAIKEDTILLCEGEPDAILARQLGFNAAAFTGGVKSIKEEHLNILIEKNVHIIFDIDDAGKQAAARFTLYLSRICPEVRNIQLPIKEPNNGDLTDFILQGGTKSDIIKLISNTQAYVLPTVERIRLSKMEPRPMLLEDAALACNAQYKQQVDAIVAGKDMEPYLIPRKVVVRCLSATTEKRCTFCGLGRSEREMNLTFGAYDPEILSIVGSSQDSARGIFRKACDIPKTCTAWASAITETMNVDDLLLIPQINYDSAIGRPYVSRRAFLVDDIAETNRPYKLTGWTAPHPATHHIVHIIEKAELSETAIDTFEMTPEIYKQLKTFQPKSDQGILEKIDEIYNDISNNITHIWERNDLLLALDLVYHSALSFVFDKIIVRRGWVEILIVGDTRTGKSETAVQIANHYKAGEVVGSENLSFAGLVGGINIIGNRRFITWGKFPLNDGRMIILDEFSGLEVEDIAKLSGIRSSGVAEITKIQTEKTHARVRLLVMSNPRKLSMKEYNPGVAAIKDLIGKAEDIARFDAALALAADEVEPEKINRRHSDEFEHIYTQDLCSMRVQWAWSRKQKNIIFQDSAIDTILTEATKMSKEYHPAIPLVEPSEQRIKLARLSVSMAAMLFSTDKSGEKVIVTSEHVIAIVAILNEWYIKSAMSYQHFSESKYRENSLINKERLIERMKGLGIESILQLYDKHQISLGDLIDLVGDRKDAQSLATFLIKCHALRKPWSYYIKTPPFTKLLIRLKQDYLRNPKGFLENEEEENNKQEGLFGYDD